ncbi:MAG: hypothetical protein RMX61_09600, partial [Planktomarina sp.]|nr:hypothetical protein [Planktomarina sp.]
MIINRLIGLVALTLSLSVSAGYADEKSKFSAGLTYVGSASVYSNVKNVSAVMPSISYNSGNLSISFQE